MIERFSSLTPLRVVVGLAAGGAVSWIVLKGGFALLRIIWPEFAAAEPAKAYSLAMLFVRLVIYSSMIATTSFAATWVARDERFAWVAGGLILAVSIPPHLYPGHVWDDYPVWYHTVYLASIVPLALVGGHWARRLFPPAYSIPSARTSEAGFLTEAKATIVDLERSVVSLVGGVATRHENSSGPRERFDGYSIGAPLMTREAPHAGEMHPDGDEILFLVSGTITVVLEDQEPPRELALGPGDAVVVPCGVWHRIRLHEPSRILHVTPGPGGEYRPV
jgi:mannose-6-phosphate isomerase-like protein (cupin superfamily)